MTSFEQWVHHAGAIVGHTIGRVTALTIGFVLMVLGVGMMVTIVMLPVGVILELLGLLIVIFGIFAPEGPASSAR